VSLGSRADVQAVATAPVSEFDLPAGVITIRGEDDLGRLPGALVRPRAVRVLLAVPGIDPDVQRQFELRLSRLLSTCGCGEGAALGLLYLVFWPVMLLTGVVSVTSALQWGLLVAGFVVTLIGGKLLGLTVARARLARQLRHLRRLLARAGRSNEEWDDA
jgi:hypothetical protein